VDATLRKFREASFEGEAGVVAHTEKWLVGDHPVCGAKMGFAEIFLMPQPYSRGGECARAKQGTNSFTRTI
jgi:hypothetical protein